MPTTRKQMALTFDAGTQAVKTGILDILQTYNVRCTFFVTGQIAELTPDYWQRATREGHQVCNHTYDHPDLRYITDDQIRQEMAMAEEIIYGITGNHARPLFRAPYGARNDHVLQICAEEGYQHVFWTQDTGDAGYATVQEIIDAALGAAQDGAVILSHCTMPNTETAMQTIVPTLLAQGYELVTVSELIAPLAVTSPPEAVFGFKSLVSVPIEPAYAGPLTVFRGAQLNNKLIGWDNETQSWRSYSMFNPGAFGPIAADYSYWFDSASPATIKVMGSTQTTPRHIMLPHAYTSSQAWTLIGYPFLTAQSWGNCSIYNPYASEPKTRSIADARTAGWIRSSMIGWDSTRQSFVTVGIPRDFPQKTVIEPWHGYYLKSYADDLQLIIPPP